MSDHALSRPGGYLRQHRVRIALWIAVVEGVLVVLDESLKWPVYGLAAIAILFWFGFARNYKSSLARQSSWIFAASQALAVLVPIVWAVTKMVVAIAIIVAIAVAALYFLFAERNKA